MGYVKNTWVDQDVERPKTYEVTTNQDGSITLTDSFGLVTELGTPVNATNMNHIENGLALSDLMKYDATVTYSTGEWVTGVVNNEKGIYASLVDNNVGNALSDDTKWEEVKLGGGARNIGEIVQSTIPLTDAGLHLLDGALIDGNGIYSAFVDYIASIYDASASYFTTEASWQNSVTNYGVCGKFVYNSTNRTVRLPKITGFVEGASGVANLGDLTQAGLPDHTHTITSAFALNDYATGSGVEYDYIRPRSGQSQTETSGADNPIYGRSNTVQPQSIKVLYYVVIATSAKTDIEVDIDEVVTDLNGKADTDLSNSSPTSAFGTALNTVGIRTVVETYGNGTSWYRVYSDGWCEQGGYAPSGTNSVTLLKPYANTNYNIQISSTYNGSSYSSNPTNKTITSFNFVYNGNAAQMWQACGYIR